MALPCFWSLVLGQSSSSAFTLNSEVSSTTEVLKQHYLQLFGCMLLLVFLSRQVKKVHVYGSPWDHAREDFETVTFAPTEGYVENPPRRMGLVFAERSCGVFCAVESVCKLVLLDFFCFILKLLVGVPGSLVKAIRCPGETAHKTRIRVVV